MKQMEMTTSEPTRRGAGLAGRLLVAQSLVLMAGALTAWTIAATVGPSVFHEHLARANVGSTSAQIFHTEAAFQSANAISLSLARCSWNTDGPTVAAIVHAVRAP